MRALVVVGLVALLGSIASAAPHKRKGTLARYIEATAPDDPPLPWPSYDFPTWLSVSFVVDRAVADAPTVDAMKAAVVAAYDGLQEGDAVALVAFDTGIEKIVGPTCVGPKQRKRFVKALGNLTARETDDLAAALDQTRTWMAPAADRKAIVVFTDLQTVEPELHAAIAAMKDARIELIVVALPGSNADALRVLTFATPVRIFKLDDAGARSALASRLGDLHDRR